MCGPGVTDRVEGHLRPESLNAGVVGLEPDAPWPGVKGEHLAGRGSPDSGAAECADDEEIADRHVAGACRRRHDEPAESARNRDQPCAVLRIDFGKEQVEATVVELAVKIRQVPVCLREVVAVELTEVLQNGAVRAVDGDQLDRPRRWMGWERGSGHRRSVALCKESPKCCVPIRVSSRQFAGGALMSCAHRRRPTRSIQRGHCPISRRRTGTLLGEARRPPVGSPAMNLMATEPHEHVVPIADQTWGLEDDRRAQTHRLTPDCACGPFAYLRLVDGRPAGTEYRHNSFAALPVDEEALEAAQRPRSDPQQ